MEKNYYGFLSMANPAHHEQLLNDLQHKILMFGKNELFLSRATTYREPLIKNIKIGEACQQPLEETMRTKDSR